jgi:L-arabinose isomerase
MMRTLKDLEFWFVTGSQPLYGQDAIDACVAHADDMISQMNEFGLPCKIVNKGVVTCTEEITKLMKEVNYQDQCAGVIIFAHTFSPSKMWIKGLVSLQKPLLHLHTQYNQEIPYATMDMDFMNLNQSAHGDRETGFIASRLRIPRKVVVGYWKDPEVTAKIAGWMRSAAGVVLGKELKIARFGDNMRYVGVTEGDKIEVEIKLGWECNSYAIDELAELIAKVTPEELAAKMAEYNEKYTMATDNIAAVEYQAKTEIAMEKFFGELDADAFADTFQDLYGMEQLPGLAVQNLMASKGMGFGAEGDWKVAGLAAVMKRMGEGVGKGGTAFMEDYTLNLEKGNEFIMGAHMLEVDPTVAATKPTIEVHPLGIGGKADPARLVFDGKGGEAICCSLVDMGGRLRLICNDVVCMQPDVPMPKLPVARCLWKPLPSQPEAAEAWIYAGGSHHSVLSFDLTAEQMHDWADMNGIEFVHIGKDLDMDRFKQRLFVNDMAFKLR